MHDFVVRWQFWVGASFVLELHGVAEALSSRGLDVAVMHLIVVGGCVEIPTVHTVVGPGAAFVGLLVHEDFTSHWCEWYFVIIKPATEVSVGGDCQYCIGLPKYVECNFGLG